MKTWSLALVLCGVVISATAAAPIISGELRQWHKLTLTLEGPEASETNGTENPFLDYRLTVVFRHESGSPAHVVPGYFAADGIAGESSATAGDKWRAHLSPDKPGKWTYEVAMVRGKGVAVRDSGGEPVAGIDGTLGSFEVQPTDKSGRDFRGKGRLQYVGKRYLRFAGTGEYFLKAGPDSPENLLAYADFDGTVPAKKGAARSGEASASGLKQWQAHARDWREGDPVWKGEKGKGLIGALNYLAGAGCTSFSFLTYNAGGDGDDVWPFVTRDDKLHYDCSKLDQWQMVLDHATRLGLYCHFKTQETESDDLNGPGAAQSLDGGDLGPERKLYYRELVARFGHLLALNWNLGEENTQTTGQQRAAAAYLRGIDPYQHPIVVHTYPDKQDAVYRPLLGRGSELTGASLQNAWNVAHERTLKWVEESEKAGRPWVVANDEQNPPSLGVPPDPTYKGFSGLATERGSEEAAYDLNDIRKATLWGTLMAGGQGVEYYFGYTLPQNDLGCEDFRSREQSWKYCRFAMEFFRQNQVPFWEMTNADERVGNAKHSNSRYCLAKQGEVAVIYLPTGGTPELDLENWPGTFDVRWYSPRDGGDLRTGGARTVTGGGKVSLGAPPSEPQRDWVVLVRKAGAEAERTH